MEPWHLSFFRQSFWFLPARSAEMTAAIKKNLQTILIKQIEWNFKQWIERYTELFWVCLFSTKSKITTHLFNFFSWLKLFILTFFTLLFFSLSLSSQKTRQSACLLVFFPFFSSFHSFVQNKLKPNWIRRKKMWQIKNKARNIYQRRRLKKQINSLLHWKD